MYDYWWVSLANFCCLFILTQTKLERTVFRRSFFPKTKEEMIPYLFKDIGKRILSFLFLHVYRRGI